MFKKLIFLFLTFATIIACTKEIDPEAIAEYEKGKKLFFNGEFTDEFKKSKLLSYEYIEKTKQYYNTAIKIDSNYTDAYYQLALITNILENKPLEANKIYLQIIKIDPKYYVAYHELNLNIPNKHLLRDEEKYYYYILAAKEGDPESQTFCDNIGLKWRDE